MSVFLPAPATGSFERVTLNYTANATAAVRIHVDFVGGAGTVEWDDITVVERNTVEYGFESGGLAPWVTFGGGAAAVTGAAARSGSFGLEVSGGSGLSVFTDLTGLTPGRTYEVTAHVRSSPGSAAAFLWLHDTTGGNLSALQPAPGAVTYQPIKVQYRANATGAVRIHLDFVGGAGTVEWDDISVMRKNTADYGFESGGLAPWVTFGGGAGAVTGAAARSGSFGLEVSGGSGLSVFTDLTGLTPGQTYEVTAYVRRSAASAAAFLWLHDTTGGNISVFLAAPGTGSFEQVTLNYTANATGAVRIHPGLPRWSRQGGMGRHHALGAVREGRLEASG